jgi:MoaA/NifB/PqqE/SkfB family radical SAM enzyme
VYPADPDFPKSICLRVTRRCNAACAFCQAPNTSRRALAVAEIEKIVAFLKMQDVATIKLTGGEPTVREDLPHILAACGQVNIRPVVITNGIHISDSVFTELKAVGGELKFSIHRRGVENDLVLRVPSFSKVLANIGVARERSVPFSINTVVTPGTIDVMPDMVGFAVRQKARKISFIPVVPRGRARTRADFEFDAPGLAKVLDTVDELSEAFNAYIDVRCIDIRTHDYWIVENDGSLWIERAHDDDDVLVCRKSELLALARMAA